MEQRTNAQRASKEQGQFPKSLFLEDGTEVRLVPLELTVRPLYVTRDGRGYTYNKVRGLRQTKPTKTQGSLSCRYPSQQRLIFRLRHVSSIYVHRAVLEAWGYPRPEGMECDHINGNHFDNRLENLEWVTRSENARRRWELYARNGKSYLGKKLTELGKRALRERGKYRKQWKLVQLTINFND